jgi:hypothetical protein
MVILLPQVASRDFRQLSKISIVYLVATGIDTPTLYFPLLISMDYRPDELGMGIVDGHPGTVELIVSL